MKVIVAIVMVFVLAISGLLYLSNQYGKSQEELSSTCAPISYGNGVYHFPCVKDDFGKRLARFKQENPEIMIGTVTSYGRWDDGHIVVTHSVQK